MARLVAPGLVINWLCIKIAAEVDMRFAAETAAEAVVLEAVVFDKIDKHIWMALTERGTTVV